MPNLAADVAAVVAAEGAEATIVSHDWGGAVAWQVAFACRKWSKSGDLNLLTQTALRVSWPTMKNSSATVTMHNVYPVARMIRPSRR